MTRTEAFNSISHLIGAGAALAGTVALIVFAALEGDPLKIVSVSVYGTTLFLLYLMSTLYHGMNGPSKAVFRVLDHQAIYLLIAGTYTPFALVTLRGSVGWWLFAAIWSLAVVGMVLDAVRRRGRRVVPMLIYLAMGWLAVVTWGPLAAALPAQGFNWLLAGGVLYTGGIVFFVLDNWFPWTHGVWHLFVMAGSVSHYVAIFRYV
jgi:hemolysin III